MKRNWIILVMGMVFPLSGFASLQHHYTFTGTNPLEDQVGSSDLVQGGTDGTLVVDPGGYTSFSGLNGETSNGDQAVYLGSDALAASYDPFVLSIWFRVATIAGQPEYSGLFSSYTGTADGFQINFLNGEFGIHTSSSDLNIISLSALTVDEWHLVTVMQDSSSANQGQIWFDGTLSANQVSIFGGLQDFRLGVNRNGERGFAGDISEVSIYNDETWDDAKQTASFVAGPVIPEPAVLSLVLLTGIGSLLIKRLFV